jgi:hypothetical protein
MLQRRGINRYIFGHFSKGREFISIISGTSPKEGK